MGPPCLRNPHDKAVVVRRAQLGRVRLTKGGQRRWRHNAMVSSSRWPLGHSSRAPMKLRRNSAMPSHAFCYCHQALFPAMSPPPCPSLLAAAYLEGKDNK